MAASAAGGSADSPSYIVEKTAGGNIVKLDRKWCDVCDLATHTLLPKLPDDHAENERGLDNFYRAHQQLAKDNLTGILLLVKSIEKSPAAMRKHVVPLFLLLGEQSDGMDPWCSDFNEDKGSHIITELYRIFDMTMIDSGPLSAFFIRDFESIANPVNTTFSRLLRNFRITLGAKDADWRSYPGARRSFQWLLLQVKYHHLGDHLEGCILPALNLMDDFEDKNITFGAQCINHILANVLKAHIKNSGWGVIIFEQYKKCLTVQHTHILDKLLPDVLTVLRMIEVDPHEYSYKFTRYDSVLECMLTVLELSEGLKKSVWLRHMTAFLEVMGHATLHWFDRIARVLRDNTTCIDTQRWLWILKCTNVCINNTWMKPNSDAFTDIILRVMFNITGLSLVISTDETKTVLEIERMAVICFQSLSHYEDFPRIREELSQMHLDGKGKLMPQFLRLMQDIFGEHAETEGDESDDEVGLKVGGSMA